MDITVNIGGAIKDYIDIEDLKKQIAFDARNQIRYAVSEMIKNDYELKQSVKVMLAEKIASAVLPQEMEDAVAKKIKETIATAEVGMVQYSWGLCDIAKEVLESRRDDIIATMQPKIDAALELTTIGDYEIKAMLSQVIINAIKEKKFDWKIDEIVTSFIQEHLESYLEQM